MSRSVTLDAPRRRARRTVFYIRADDRLVGHCWLRVDGVEGELGCSLHAVEDRGQGIGGDAVRQLLLIADGMGLRRLWLRTEATNMAALRAAERLGFARYDERRRSVLMERGRR